MVARVAARRRAEMFGKRKPEQVDRSKVMGLVAAEMRAWDKDDREHASGRRSAELERLEKQCADARRKASPAEQRAAHEALRRHGYPSGAGA